MYSFNPYTILGIEEGATPKEVKQAYRKLSVLYHPDKNTGANATKAQNMFIQVAKAHEVLTDDATRENYEKYGNPDGYHGVHPRLRPLEHHGVQRGNGGGAGGRDGLGGRRHLLAHFHAQLTAQTL
jgi:DnaJ-class molecular chaperone